MQPYWSLFVTKVVPGNSLRFGIHFRKLSYYTLLYLKVYLLLAEDKQNKCKETTGAFYCSCVRCYVMVYNMYVDDTCGYTHSSCILIRFWLDITILCILAMRSEDAVSLRRSSSIVVVSFFVILKFECIFCTPMWHNVDMYYV